MRIKFVQPYIGPKMVGVGDKAKLVTGTYEVNEETDTSENVIPDALAEQLVEMKIAVKATNDSANKKERA